MQRALNSLGVVFFPAFDWSISATHPERQERLLYTMDQLQEEGIFDIEGIREYKPDMATLEDIQRVHFSFPDAPSNVTNSHLISAGGAIKAGKLLMDKQADKTFALVRPPGHHAMKCVHGGRGFCNVNIEAIMVEYLRENYNVGRVAIIDTDCHHGDGTQDIYWHDPDTLYISMHQDGRTMYPGSGFPQELGGPKALGKTINIPLPPLTADEGFLLALENIVMPILEDFQPDLIINSAGQDNHYTDPITSMNFSAQGYATLNKRLNPDIAVLEGGYSIHGALPYVNTGIILAMAGLEFGYVKEPDFDQRSRNQETKIEEYLQKLSAALLDFYHHPPLEKLQIQKKGDYFYRNKRIFYDTDYINEEQDEYLLDCGQCPGLLIIQSSSTKARGCLGIEIPRNSCDHCRQTGWEKWEQAKGDRYSYIQLIDRNRGEFLSRAE